MTEQKLFNLVAKPKEGQCEARRCKNDSTQERGEDKPRLWERKAVKLCDGHAKEAAEFSITHPTFEYTPPSTAPQPATVLDSELQAELQEYAKDGGEIAGFVKGLPTETAEDVEAAKTFLGEIQQQCESLEAKEKEVTGKAVQEIRDAFLPARGKWLEAETELKAKIAAASAE